MKQHAISAGRTSAILREAVSQFLLKVAHREPFITVSYIQLNRSGHTATVYCSVFPEDRAEQALAFLKRKESLCREHIRNHTSLRIIPTIRFSLAKRV